MKSILEKSRDRIIQTNQTDLIQKVDSMHKILKTKLNSGNSTTARQAEEFLNWLIFGKGILKNNEIDKVYRNELLNNNTFIQNIQQKFQGFAIKSQDYSYRFSNVASEKLLEELLKEYGGFSQERGIKTEELFVELINSFTNTKAIESTGAKSATVVIERFNKKFLEKMGQDGEKVIKKLVADGKKFRYGGRSMKSDTQGGNIQYTIMVEDPNNYIKACIEVFSNTSIKSITNMERIHLENVDIYKAYSAFMRFSYSNKFLTQKAIKNIFDYYYNSQEGEDKEYITRHLNHLFRIYAYSGFGTSPLDDLDNISKGVSYLVVVDNLQQYIYVKSSSEVINFLLNYPTNKTLKPDIYLNLNALLKNKY